MDENNQYDSGVEAPQENCPSTPETALTTLTDNETIEIIVCDTEAEKKNCSRIGFGFAIFTIISLIAAYSISFAVYAINPDFYNSMLFRNMVSPVAIYLFALPVLLIILSKCKAEPPQKKKIGFFGMICFFIVGFGLMYIGNILGNLVMSIISSIVGYDYSNMLSSIIDADSMWVTVIFVVIIAPIGEELVFRKMIIDRTHKYGGAVCILLSALMFGMMHANFYQFFYAFALGLVLGYLYYRTGNVILTIIIHSVINFFGSVVATNITEITLAFEEVSSTGNAEAIAKFAAENIFSIAFMIVYVLFIYFCMIWAPILPIILRKKIILGKGALAPDKKRGFEIVFVNLGIAVMFAIYALEFIFNLIP